MKVKISTWVNAGSGHPHQIIDAMVDSGLPYDARAVELDYEHLYLDGGIETQICTRIKFEWEEDR